jgi:hypothetical protein
LIKDMLENPANLRIFGENFEFEETEIFRPPTSSIPAKLTISKIKISAAYQSRGISLIIDQ